MKHALQAKLADPNMSLFHALKAGGFNYLDDIDAKAVDEEGVTLAQRKNQLSRRLRMTKPTEPQDSLQGASEHSQYKQTLDDLVQAQQANFQNLLRQDTGGSSVASADSSSCTYDHSTVGQSGQYRQNRESGEGYGMSSTRAKANARRESYQVSESIDSFDSTSDQQDRKMGATAETGTLTSDKGFFDPFRDKDNNPTHISSRATGEEHFHRSTHDPTRPLSRKTSEISFAATPPGRYLPRMAPRPANDSAAGTQLCSECGLRSLHRTAQSVGLTLDQLALVLSSTEDLSALLGIHNPRNNENEEHRV